MWLYRRLFTTCILFGLLFGFYYFFRLLKLNISHNRPPPDFLPNVSRFKLSRVCSPRAVVIVNSSPGHRHRRQAIRETWGHPKITLQLDFNVAFGIGRASNADLQRLVDLESEIFGDIFQEPGVDNDGTSSSSKVVQLLKSVRGACSPQPEFVLKTEDSVFVNPFHLDSLLQNFETFSSSNTLWCLEWQRMFDKPNNNLTWIVPQAEFNNPFILRPTYCLSTVYLMTGRTLDALIKQHDGQTNSAMLPEDVYVTGMLVREARIFLSQLGERVAFNSTSKSDIDAKTVAFAYAGEDIQDVAEEFWKTLSKYRLQNFTWKFDITL